MSYLPKRAFRELRRTVYESLDKHDVRSRNWQRMKDSVLEALADLAKKHHCGYEFNSEGGNICIYKSKRPVFAIRIGHYHNQMKHLLKGEALFRGIIDISRSGNVFYIPLPTRQARKWTINDENELLHVIGCLKEDGPLSQRGLACILGITSQKSCQVASARKEGTTSRLQVWTKEEYPVERRMRLRLKDIMRITRNVKVPKNQRLRRPSGVVLKRSPRSQIPFHHR